MTKEKFIDTICLLQGFRVNFKNCHWFLRDQANKHKTLDELIDIITEYTDGFAEEGIMIFGDIGLNMIKASQISYSTPEELVMKFGDFTLSIKRVLEKTNSVELSGLISITDDLIHRVNQNRYRFGMN